MIIDREVSTDIMLIIIVTFNQDNQYRMRRKYQRLFEYILLSGLSIVLYNSNHSKSDCERKFKQKAGALVARWMSIGNPECYQQCCCLNSNIYFLYHQFLSLLLLLKHWHLLPFTLSILLLLQKRDICLLLSIVPYQKILKQFYCLNQ